MTATSSLPVGEGPRLLLTVPDAAAALSISRSKLYELLTVADYLAQWLEAHATTVKPKTLGGYRHDIDHYIVPRIGRLRLQALRPAVISKLYRDLSENGGSSPPGWGEPLYPDTVSALMGKLIAGYNDQSVPQPSSLPHVRLHDLRHLQATTLLLAGVPVHVVAARLGHADPAVTLRVYAHVLREQAASVGNIFAQAVDATVSKSVSKPRRQG